MAGSRNEQKDADQTPDADDGKGTLARTRRNFLKWMGLVSVAAVELNATSVPAAVPSGQVISPRALDKVTSVDVAVIGGGFAGTTAAREVIKAGLRTVLLEARNRLGGRTFYTKFDDDPVELGGECVHWLQPNVWAEILHYGLTIDEIPGMALSQRLMWMSEGKVIEPPSDESVAMVLDGMEKFNRDAATIFPRPYDNLYSSQLVQKYDGMSIMDRLNQLRLPIEQADLVQAMMETLASSSVRHAAYLDAVKWWALAGNNLSLMNDAWERYRLRDGTISLINAMIDDAKVPVFLSAPVLKIQQTSTGVEVTLQSGKIVKARKAIVAVPLNVLQYIQFEPALSSLKLEASKETHSGHGIQLFIRVKGPMPAFFALAHEPEPLSAIWIERTNDQNSLLGATGPDSARLDIHSTEQVQMVLRRFFPAAEVEATIGYDWTLDPYARGTWCVYRPNQLTRYSAELRKPEGNVHFASADWAVGWRGFMDGAIERGRHVGQVVARSLRG
jgi:pseudooxynicotine oxidase